MNSFPLKRLFFATILLYFTLPFIADGQSISGFINSHHKVTAINFATNTITLANSVGLTPGTKVLLIQMKGATINTTNTASFGNITVLNDAGNYEFNFICGVAGNDVLLQMDLVKNYNVSGFVQLVSVPQYTSVTVTDTIRTIPWDATNGIGGIIVLNATDTVFLNSGIEAYGKGFSGGAAMNYPTPTYDCIWTTDINNFFLSFPPAPSNYYTGGKKGEGIADYLANSEYGKGKQANGGGGGNNHNTGGAGGANYGTGGNGGRRSNESAFNCHGPSPGVGGLSLSPNGYTVANNRIFLGGGGGGGHQNNLRGMPGGNGGGIVMISASVIVSAGRSILANGAMAMNVFCANDWVAEGDGGGGGGAGGTIILDVNQVNGSIIASANGAAGNNSSHNVNDCTGAGGGGGGGVVWVKGAAFPPTITSNVNGGINGVVAMTSLLVACRGLANGATPGANGASLIGYIAPLGTSPLCYPLPLKELQYFRGKLTDDGAMLWWKMNEVRDIASYSIERSIDRVRFTTIRTIKSSGFTSFDYHDKEKKEGTVYYRLRVLKTTGMVEYSEVITVTRPNSWLWQWISLLPNPVSFEMKATVFSTKQLSINSVIYDAYGKKINQTKVTLNPGYTNIVLPASILAAGVYLLVLEGEGIKVARKFIKQ